MSSTCVKTTISYYDQNAELYVRDTVSVSFSDVQEKFLSCLNPGAFILDFGCGSGRDTKCFLDRGFRVDALDGSKRLCEMARALTGIEVQNKLFSELDAVEKYDGIWACSSILHLPSVELRDVLIKMQRALKHGGYIYTSFKYGEYEGERNGRFFHDFTQESFRAFIEDLAEIQIVKEWISSDVRPGRGEERWLNLILKKE